MYYHFPHVACKNGILIALAYAALLTLSPFSPARAQAIETEVRAILIDDSIRYEEKRERFVELGKPAVPALVHHLIHGDRTTRFIVIGALGRIKDKRATLPLMSALEGDNAHVVLPALVEISDEVSRIDARAADPDATLLEVVGLETELEIETELAVYITRVLAAVFLCGDPAATSAGALGDTAIGGGALGDAGARERVI